jgi:hypothetical protein
MLATISQAKADSLYCDNAATVANVEDGKMTELEVLTKLNRSLEAMKKGEGTFVRTRKELDNFLSRL